MSSSEVSGRLQEIRLNLEKAVDLMERERPGSCEKRHPNADTVRSYSNVSLSVVQKVFVTSPCSSAPPSDEALRLLRRTHSQSGLILAETHPVQGELADAMARAYATMGENTNT